MGFTGFFPVHIVLLALLTIIGLIYLFRYFGQQPVRLPIVPGTGFGWGDGVLVTVLIALNVFLAVESFGVKIPLSTQLVQIMLMNCLVYTAIILLIVGVMVARHRDPIRLFGLRWPVWKSAIPTALLALAAAYPAITLTQVIVQYMLGPETQLQPVLEFLRHSGRWTDKFALFVMAALFAPLAEEVVFRGYIYGVLRQYIGLWPALLVTSAVFAAIHVHVPAMAGLFLFAVLLTLVYERTGSLWAPILLHAVFNSITLTITLLWPEAMP